jgi:4-oxalocrotonate tautomerase family enzyme
MPTVNIELLEGRAEGPKRRLMEAVTSAVCEALSVDAETVNVRIWELRRDATARGGRFFSDMDDPAVPAPDHAG